MKNKKIFTPLIGTVCLFIVLHFVFTSCSQPEAVAPSIKESNKEEQALSKTIAVKFDNPEYEISLPGELHPYEQVAIHAKVTGFVKQLLVDRGTFVKKGQLLAVLEAPELDQRLNADKSAEQKLYSDYLFTKQAYERLKQAALTSGAVAEIELDKSKSAMESALATYNAAKSGTAGTIQMRDYLNIRAPFDGIITDKNVSVGALVGVNSGEPLLMIAQGDRLRLTVSLPEKHAASVHRGTQAIFTASSRLGEQFSAKLSRSSTLLDRQDRSLTIEFDVPNHDGRLQGGDYAQVKLRLKRKTSTNWVPQKSIVRAQSGTFLFTVVQGQIKKVMVKEGIQRDSLTEVFGQLKEGDMVLSAPSEETQAVN